MVRHWFAIDVNGLAYQVVLCDKDAPVLEGGEGMTDYLDSVIWLRESDNKARLRDALVHEILHACFEASGASYLLASHLRKRARAEPGEVEEQLIRALAPSLITALRSARLLGNLP